VTYDDVIILEEGFNMELTYIEKLFISALVARANKSGMSKCGIDRVANTLIIDRFFLNSNGHLLNDEHLKCFFNKVGQGHYRLDMDNIANLDLSFTYEEYIRHHHGFAGFKSHELFLDALQKKRVELERRELLERQYDEERMEANWRAWEAAEQAEVKKLADYESRLKAAKSDQAECMKSYEREPSYWDKPGLFGRDTESIGSSKEEVFNSLCFIACELSNVLFLDEHPSAKCGTLALTGEEFTLFVQNFLTAASQYDFVHVNIRGLLGLYEMINPHDESPFLNAFYPDLCDYWNYCAGKKKEPGMVALKRFFFKALVRGIWDFRHLNQGFSDKMDADREKKESNVVDLGDHKKRNAS